MATIESVGGWGNYVYTPKADDVKKLFELAKENNLEFDPKELYLYLISTVYGTCDVECECECEIEEEN